MLLCNSHVLFVVVLLLLVLLLCASVYSSTYTPTRVYEPIDATLGDPCIYKSFLYNRICSNTSDYVPYVFGPTDSLTSTIYDAHRRIGNLPHVTNQRIAISNGSMQMINAYLQFVSARINKSTKYLYAPAPYFFLIQRIAPYYGFILSTTPANADVEYVNIIRNPTGQVTLPSSSAPYRIYDCAYLWPQYTPVDIRALTSQIQLREYDCATFTSSKSVGIAGARIGYAFGSSTIIDKLQTRIFDLSLGVSYSLRQVICAYQQIDAITTKARHVLQTRQDQLKRVLGLRLLNTNGAYAWTAISADEWKSVGVIASNGNQFGASSNKSRLSYFICDFDRLLLAARRIAQTK